MKAAMVVFTIVILMSACAGMDPARQGMRSDSQPMFVDYGA